MSIHSPWDAARHLGVTVIRTPLDHARGYTDGCGRIWVDPRQTYVEQTCTLAHELLHVIHGHVGAQPDHVEEEVRRATARWLVPWHRVLEVVGDQLTLYDMAEALSVTTQVLADRLQHATARELERLERHPACDTYSPA